MDDTYLQEQITATKATIALYVTAIDFLVANPTKAYSLDTGQSRQDVKRQDLETLQAQLDSLYNRLATFGARLNGAATVVQPYY